MGACFSKHSQTKVEDLDTPATTTAAAIVVDEKPSDLKNPWRSPKLDLTNQRNETVPASPVICPSSKPNSSSVSLSSSGHARFDRQKQNCYGVNRNKASSPIRPMMRTVPSSPDQRKSPRSNTDEDEKTDDDDDEEEEEEEEEEELKDYKFPSFARKQWLSQQAESLKKSSSSSSHIAMKAEIQPSLRRGYGGEENLMSHQNILPSSSATRNTVSTTGKKNTSSLHIEQNSELINNSIALTPKKKTFLPTSLPSSSATAEVMASTQRYSSPSSPLKRVQSVRDNHPGSPRFSKNSSLRGSVSPNTKHQEAIKARPLQYSNNITKQNVPSDHHQHYQNNPSSSSFSASHRRHPSRDSAELAPLTEGYMRKPSPPKKSSLVVIPSSSSSTSSLSSVSVGLMNRQTHQSKASVGHESFTSSCPASRKGTITTSSMAGIDQNDTNLKNLRKRENSPLRRTTSAARIADGSMENRINSEISHLDLIKDKEMGTTGLKKSHNRTPLREIQVSERENANGVHARSTNFLKLQAASKEKFLVPMSKTNDGNTKETTITTYLQNDDSKREHIDDEGKYIHENESLELKAEKLVKGGKSVLSAFKALEEYRSNHHHHHRMFIESETLHNKEEEEEDGDDDNDDENAKYRRQQSYSTITEPRNQQRKIPNHRQSQHLQQKIPNHQQNQQNNPTQDAEAEMRRLFTKKESGAPMQSSSSLSKRASCEPFVFPDVQSGGLAIPASVSKACSILKAVADLNMGGSSSMYSKETRDEIEKPNLSSFQFE